MVKHTLYAVSLGLILFFLYLFQYTGAFKSVSVDQDERGPYTVIYKTHVGAYHHIVSTIEEIEKWQEQMIEYYKEEMIWVKNIYWKLEEFSCVLIQRNNLWFKNNVNTLANIWSIIKEERKTGFQHRLPASANSYITVKKVQNQEVPPVFMNIEESPLFRYFSLKTNL